MFKFLVRKDVAFFVSMPAVAWIVLFFYVPLTTVIAQSFCVTTSSTSAFSIMSLGNYVNFIDWPYLAIIRRSLFLAFSTATVCLVVGYPVAYFIARRARRWKNVLLFLVMLPFSVNLLIQAYAWFFMLGRAGLLNTILLKLGIVGSPVHILNTPWAVYVGMVYCYVPFMILPLYAIFEKLDERLIEASLDLGARWWATWLHVIMPLSSPGVRTGFFLVFIPVFGEFVIPALLGGGKQMFVGSLISYYYLTVRNFALGSAFTCISSCVVVCASFFIYRYLSKQAGVVKTRGS